MSRHLDPEPCTKPDRYTTHHPARNAVVILLLITMAQGLADLATRWLP